MEDKERFVRIATASPEVLKRIDEILEGKVSPRDTPEPPDCKLISVTEAARRLGLTYATFHRMQQAGCFDIVTATGKTWIKESSVREFALGKRNPSEEYLVSRAARNRRRRFTAEGFPSCH